MKNLLFCFRTSTVRTAITESLLPSATVVQVVGIGLTLSLEMLSDILIRLTKASHNASDILSSKSKEDRK